MPPRLFLHHGVADGPNPYRPVWVLLDNGVGPPDGPVGGAVWVLLDYLAGLSCWIFLLDYLGGFSCWIFLVDFVLTGFPGIRQNVLYCCL